MKKVLAAILMLAVAVCFAACGDKNQNPTPQLSLSANMSAGSTNTALPVSDSTASSESSSESLPISTPQNGEGTTMVLTTKQGETAPTVLTTVFVPDPAAVTTAISTTPFLPPTPSGSPYGPPPVVTSQITPTSPNTTGDPTSDLFANRSTTTTKNNQTQPSTTAQTRKSKSVVINDIATTPEKKMIVTINSNGWDGKFKNNSQNISVKVDGDVKVVPCSVSSGSQNADGFPYITIDLSGVSVPEGSNVQFTIPSAFLQTTSGAQYSSAFSGAYTMM